MDSLSEQEGEVAHDVDDQRLDDPGLLGELQEEGGHAADQGSDGLKQHCRALLRWQQQAILNRRLRHSKRQKCVKLAYFCSADALQRNMAYRIIQLIGTWVKPV